MKIISGLPYNGNRKMIMQEINREINDFVTMARDRLIEDPGLLRIVEWEALRMCISILGKIVGMILADERVGESAEQKGMQSRPEHVRSGRKVKRNILLPGGIKMQVESVFCAPKAGSSGNSGKRGKEGGGVYPEFSSLGILEGKSPLTADLLLRFAVQLPSFALTRKELAQLGFHFDLKTIGRTVRDYGKQAVSARNAQLEAWRRGELAPGNELEGRRVVAGVDGGRVRIREKKRRRKNGKKQKYAVPWREPKLLIIYVIDSQGKIDHKFSVQIDATLAGPDAAMELLAFHLYRLGASKAEIVEFVSDGAPWIWNRLDQVIAMAGLDPRRCYKVLDLYHACEHVSDALDVCGLKGKEKKRQFTRLKKLLKLGRADEVVCALSGYKTKVRGKQKKKDLQKDINYLQKRLPFMRYGTFKRKRLALGSGAVESAIRRVINLRIKGPAIYWDKQTAEVVLHLRAQLLSDRWDYMMDNIREHSKVSRHRNIYFNPTICAKDTEAA